MTVIDHTASEKIRFTNEIFKSLTAMQVGFCAVKFFCVVWRVTEYRWHVGIEGFDVKGKPLHIDEAIDYIYRQFNMEEKS